MMQTQLGTIQAQLKALGRDPFEGVWRVAQKAEQAGDLATAVRAYAELAQYHAPKLKAIEHSRAPDKPYEQMTDEELDAIIRGGKPTERRYTSCA